MQRHSHPKCAICGATADGLCYDLKPARHYCDNCCRLMELARFSPVARGLWDLICNALKGKS